MQSAEELAAHTRRCARHPVVRMTQAHMADFEEEVTIVVTDTDVFVVVGDVKIARRGYPGTPQAGTWVSLEPGWEVVGPEGLERIGISYKGAKVH